MRKLILSLFVLAGGSLLAQQQWVPLGSSGVVGVVAPDSPLPPLVITPYGQYPPRLHQCENGAFHARPDTPVAELDHADAATYDAANARLVVHTVDFPLFGGPGSSAMCVFDGARWSVLATIGAPPLRQDPALAFDPVRGTVLMFGGNGPGFPTGTPLGDTWELVGNTWLQRAVTGPPPRKGARLAPTSNGMLLFGGTSGGVDFADTWLWNGTTWSQLFPATAPSPRSGHALAFDPVSSTNVLYGGTAAPQVLLGDAWSWNGTNWSALQAPALPPLMQAGLARDNGQLVLIGRTNTAPSIVHVQRWLGNGWQPLYQSPSLPDVFLPAFALDTAHQEIVRFGGRDGNGTAYRNDTWTWNGAWQLRTSAAVPPARSYTVMAFDPLRGEAVLFGGRNDTTYFGDTWVWNGTTWSPRAPANAPAARHLHTMCWDPGRGRIVLFGGYDASQHFRDTWEWDGANWSVVPSASLPPPLRGALAFDYTRSVLALYIDQGSVQPSELWELQAGNWIQVSTSVPAIGQLAFDPAFGALTVQSPYGSVDYVSGVWLPRLQQAQTYLVSDFARGGLLSVPSAGSVVLQSTFAFARTSTYGTGCGPVGEVTTAYDRHPVLGAVATARVRTFGASTPTFLFFGTTERDLPIGGGCSVYLDGLLLGLGGLADASGWAPFPLSVPSTPSLAGTELFAQAVTLYAVGLGIGNGTRLRVGL